MTVTMSMSMTMTMTGRHKLTRTLKYVLCLVGIPVFMFLTLTMKLTVKVSMDVNVSRIQDLASEAFGMMPTVYAADNQSIMIAQHGQHRNFTSESESESFSACLLVMDENFRLYEWIAYHYHVLPLRYLVVAVDPRSSQSPEPVLDLFRQNLNNMTIVSWNDSDYITWNETLPPDAGLANLTARHRVRQRRFMSQCLLHMYQKNRTWTALWDVDEYIAFNGYNRTRQHPASNTSSSSSSSSSSFATSPKNMREEGSILRYLKDFGEEGGIGMNRRLVGSKEDPSLMKEPHPYDPRRFDSLRNRFRARPGRINGYGKCMLNVQKVPSHPYPVRKIHRPVFELCPGPMGDHLLQSPFLLDHFIGSWEAYSYRDDSRRGKERTREIYLKKAQQNDVYENKMSPWMTAFVQNVGEERGAILLQNAGLDPEYNATHKIDDWKKVNPAA